MLTQRHKIGLLIGGGILGIGALLSVPPKPNPLSNPNPPLPMSASLLAPTFQYPEPELTADGAPYTFRIGAVTVSIASDSAEPASRYNQWLRVDQGAQAHSNFVAGTKMLTFPNASQVTLTFAPAVHGVMIALGNSDIGDATYICTGAGITAIVKGVSGPTGSAPQLDFAAPAGFNELVIKKEGDRPQCGLLLGPISYTP